MKAGTMMRRLPYQELDEFGADPLKDRALALLDEITHHEPFVVSAEYDNNAPLLSYDRYGTTDGWWVILAYNGMCRMAELKAGTNILIPARGSVIDILSKAADKRDDIEEAFQTNSGADRLLKFKEW